MIFKYFTSVVTMRIPVKEDGSVGLPEILKKTTFETKDPRSKNKPTKKEPTLILGSSEDEEELI